MSQREQELKDSLWEKYGPRFKERLLDICVRNGNGHVYTSRTFIRGYESVGEQVLEGWSHGEETVINELHVFPIFTVGLTEDGEIIIEKP